MSNRPSPQYLTILANFASNLVAQDLPQVVRERARWIVTDCIPVIAAGMQVSEMKALVDKHLVQAAPGCCWVIGTSKRAASLDAALLNGTAGTWLELDEGIAAKGHPGIQIVPAAVALAQELGASGIELQVAVTAGYEVSARISLATKTNMAVHPHGTYGVIGAAVAAGKLKRFNPLKMLELINIAATMGMATSRNTLLEGATVRNIFTGHSGYMGLMAARLVECGFTGEADGVSEIYSKVLSDFFEPSKVVEDLHKDWLISKGYFKLHPTGRSVQSAIDALEDLLARLPEGRLDIEKIERIEVRSYSRSAILNGKNVTSSFGARFSVPFALASIIFHGRSSLKCFQDEAVLNPKIQALTQRVNLQEDKSFTSRYPKEQPLTLRIILSDGTVYTGQCIVMKGESGNPHKEGELTTKFFDLGEPIWGKDATRLLYSELLQMDKISDFGAFAKQFSL